jgi:glycine/D-amino acid oxidase-like deaminating enzyme
MQRVVVVGCGVVGAAIAYTLSQAQDLTVTVLDQQPPAQAASGAALGVLMGVISRKLKGNNLQMRLRGLQLYDEWIPQLEKITGWQFLYNRQGILRLCFEDEDLGVWARLAAIRQQQGLELRLYDRAELVSAYPYLNLERVIGAVYSPGDRQVDPVALTLALAEAAQQQGVTFQLNARVTDITTQFVDQAQMATQVQTAIATFACDWLVIAAGLGSTSLTASLQHSVELQPVLGQAIRLRLPTSAGLESASNLVLPPVITGEDIHLVPLGNAEYWLGATVEMPIGESVPQANEVAWQEVWQKAIALYPALEHATKLQQWSGLRPRPIGRPAPIIEKLPGYHNVLLATGHYRNGVLLAPATAEKIYTLIRNYSASDVAG